MIAIDILKEAEKVAGLWPANLPGHVNFGAEAIDVHGELEDGAHRLEGSAWQFVVEGGRIISAVREDLQAWRRDEETVYGVEPKEPEPQEPEPQEPGTPAA